MTSEARIRLCVFLKYAAHIWETNAPFFNLLQARSRTEAFTGHQQLSHLQPVGLCVIKVSTIKMALVLEQQLKQDVDINIIHGIQVHLNVTTHTMWLQQNMLLQTPIIV